MSEVKAFIRQLARDKDVRVIRVHHAVKAENDARTHARRSLYCACGAALTPEEMGMKSCMACWALRDEDSAGVRPLGMQS